MQNDEEWEANEHGVSTIHTKHKNPANKLPFGVYGVWSRSRICKQMLQANTKVCGKQKLPVNITICIRKGFENWNEWKEK